MKRRRENTGVRSGIGCAARFPYYSVHLWVFTPFMAARPPFATGNKTGQPDLRCLVGFRRWRCLVDRRQSSAHTLRRNVDITMLLHNNGFIGLTKGPVFANIPQGYRSPSTARRLV